MTNHEPKHPPADMAGLDGLIERLRSPAAVFYEYASDNGALLAEAADLIERLIKAGNELGYYAGHDDSCACVKGWATGPCNCGYTETWNQWRAALGEKQ